MGSLYICYQNQELKLIPQIDGGGHEKGMRSGTLNVSGIVGFGEACRIAQVEMEDDAKRIAAFRDHLEASLMTELPDIWINGDIKNRLPNTSNIGFSGVEARVLIHDMYDIAVSTSSACSSSLTGPSHVLRGIGLTDEQVYSSVRFSLGRFTTEAEIDYTIEKVVGAVRKLRR